MVLKWLRRIVESVGEKDVPNTTSNGVNQEYTFAKTVSKKSKMDSNKKDKVNIKEIHSTSFVDKQLPTIKYTTRGMKSMTEGGEMTIEVSDVEISKAFNVFGNILAMITTQQNQGVINTTKDD